MNVCTCVEESSAWVCGKWVRVTKSAGVGGGWALSQREEEGRYVWAAGDSSGSFACKCLKETVQAFLKGPRTLGVKTEAESRRSGGFTDGSSKVLK